MRKVILGLAITGGWMTLQAETPTTETQAAKTETKAPSGYTVTGEFPVDANENFSNAKVVGSEAIYL
jgi:hypothetical protein